MPPSRGKRLGRRVPADSARRTVTVQDLLPSTFSTPPPADGFALRWRGAAPLVQVASTVDPEGVRAQYRPCTTGSRWLRPQRYLLQAPRHLGASPLNVLRLDLIRFNCRRIVDTTRHCDGAHTSHGSWLRSDSSDAWRSPRLATLLAVGLCSLCWPLCCSEAAGWPMDLSFSAFIHELVETCVSTPRASAAVPVVVVERSTPAFRRMSTRFFAAARRGDLVDGSAGRSSGARRLPAWLGSSKRPRVRHRKPGRSSAPSFGSRLVVTCARRQQDSLVATSPRVWRGDRGSWARRGAHRTERANVIRLSFVLVLAFL
ncbi:hypothetical protein ON010_g18452 [Phytophthora cinnamomi]|nr:hypothetical protein ON010_g18452 [Phytophthora cinnamomi]